MVSISPKLLEVTPLENFRLRVRYGDGTQGEVDLSDLAGRGVFSAWEVPGAFESVHIGPLGELAWVEDLDLCADAVYMRLIGVAPLLDLQGTVLPHSGPEDFDRVRETVRKRQATRIAEGRYLSTPSSKL